MKMSFTVTRKMIQLVSVHIPASDASDAKKLVVSVFTSAALGTEMCLLLL